MSTPEKIPKKRTVKKLILFSFLVVVSIAGIFLYNNFNRLLSQALLRSFDSSIISDVYELQFENLQVNFLNRTIRVFNVTMQPRENPLHPFPYINSSFRLKTEQLTLKNVELFTLLELNQLRLERISITKPDVELNLAGDKHIFVPFKDSTTITTSAGQVKKKFIESFLLSEFQLVEASFHIINSKKQREFKIREFTISLQDLLIDQRTRKDLLSVRQVELSLGGCSGVLKKGAVKRVNFTGFNLGVASLKFQMTPDTVIFNFKEFATGLNDLDIQTADSLFHLTVKSFRLSYKGKSVKLSEISFKPNISDAAMQKRFPYQHTQVSGTVGSVNFINVNFDSLIYYKGLFIHEIILDKPIVAIFKDNTKPLDKNHLPIYFGQQISGISLPLWIGQIKAADVQLTNVERKRDSSYARVTIHRGTALVTNITNRPTNKPLTLSANAYIEDKVHFNLTLGFSYSKPQFSLDGKLEKFNFQDINTVIQAYIPAKINSGIADEIVFSGTVSRTRSTGTMKFLYHDLVVDLELRNKARWKSSVIAFAANTAVNASNPGSTRLPPRVVRYHVDRDMHKGFINIIIKSVLTGVKETLIMSKENRKAYREAKKRMKGTKN